LLLVLLSLLLLVRVQVLVLVGLQVVVFSSLRLFAFWIRLHRLVRVVRLHLLLPSPLLRHLPLLFSSQLWLCGVAVLFSY
jgi:hypothetical protein